MGKHHVKAAAHYERQFGRVIRQMREARGWSQAELAARLASIGFEYHQTTIGKLESGARALRIGELFAMSSVFEVQAADLLAAVIGQPDHIEGRVREIEEHAARLREDFVEQLDGYVADQVSIARQLSAALQGSDDGEHPTAP